MICIPVTRAQPALLICTRLGFWALGFGMVILLGLFITHTAETKTKAPHLNIYSSEHTNYWLKEHTLSVCLLRV